MPVAQRSFLNAVKWSYASSWGDRAFSALFTFLLAGLLGPRDFGIASIALIYINFLQIFLDQGFVAALIQRKDLEDQHLNAVFWMDAVLSLVLVGLSVLLSRWWGAVNHTSELGTITFVLTLCIPIEGLAIVQKSLLLREMDFKSLSIRSNISVLIGGAIGVAAAYKGLGVWALVYQQIAKDTAALVLLWRLSSWRPKFEFSLKHLRELIPFSASNFVAQLGIFADAQASSIVLGLWLGPAAVGLYRLADRFVSTVVTMATSSIQAVSLPEFSRLQSDPAALRKSTLSCIQLSCTVTLPALAGLAAVGEPLLAIIGRQWIPAADVLRVLCLGGMALIFAYFTGPMLQALSQTRKLMILEWTRSVVGVALLAGVTFLLRHSSVAAQVAGVAWARAGTVLLFVAPVFVWLLLRLTGLPLRDLALAAAPSLASSASLTAAVALFKNFNPLPPGRPVFLLAEDVAVGGCVGLAVLFLLDASLRGFVVRLFRRSGAVESLAEPTL